MKSFGDKLRQTRIAAGLTQRAAADVLGVSLATLRDWEKGITAPTAGKIFNQRDEALAALELVQIDKYLYR